jgi:hypothetical protein
MLINDALELVNQTHASNLVSLTREELMFIVQGMTPEEAETFIFEKNIKIFGSINLYIDDFFKNETVGKILQLPSGNKLGVISVLKKMLSYEGVTKKNKARIEKALKSLNGGRRKTRKN